MKKENNFLYVALVGFGILLFYSGLSIGGALYPEKSTAELGLQTSYDISARCISSLQVAKAEITDIVSSTQQISGMFNSCVKQNLQKNATLAELSKYNSSTTYFLSNAVQELAALQIGNTPCITFLPGGKSISISSSAVYNVDMALWTCNQ